MNGARRQDIENLTFEEAVDLFFEAPQAHRGDGWVSPLCLCRQELQDCLVGEIVGEDRIFDYPRHRLFASAMVALSGIELLARMVPPPREGAGSGEMFRAIIKRYSTLARMPVSDEDAKVLLDTRNALSHTFGLYCEGKGGVHIPLIVFSSDQDEELVKRTQRGGYEICLELLVRLFIRMVQAFRTDLERTPSLQPTFMKAFHKYGLLFQQGPHLPSRDAQISPST